MKTKYLRFLLLITVLKKLNAFTIISFTNCEKTAG